MPIYEYKALTRNGKIKTGILDADTSKDARNKLRVEGIHVTSIKQIDGGKKSSFIIPNIFAKRNLTDLAMVTRQLATLMESGIPLRESLSALIDQIDDRNLQTAFRDIREKVTSGISFADALAEHPFYFGDLYVNMIRAGEASGTIDAILNRIADYLQAQSRMKGKVSAALAYPIVMSFIGAGVVIFLMTFVVPKIKDVLVSQGKGLPLPTQILVTLSEFCVSWWPVIILGTIGIMIALKKFVKTKIGKRYHDNLMISIPVLGILFKKQAVSRFAVTFSTLLQSGIPALDALKIVRHVVDNVIMADTLDEVAKTIIEGGEIAAPFRKSKVFPSVVGYMIGVGERSGKLDSILTKIAQAYDEEIDVTTQKVTALLEPIMIVVLSSIVGFIVLAIILPIMQMSQL